MAVKTLKMRLAKPGKRATVELKDPETGEALTVEIQEINLAQKGSLFRSTGGLDDDGNPKDMERLTAELVRLCTFEPGSNRRVFASADEVSAAGPHIDPLIQKCLEFMSPKEAELAGKSEATESSAPASPSPTP